MMELILVIAIMGILATIVVPVGISYYKRSLVDDARDQAREILRKARSQSVLQKNDSRYGVSFWGHTITLFSGVSSTSNPSLNEDYVVVDRISFSGTLVNPVYFAKRTGLPNATGTVVISDGETSRTITMDDFGNVSK